MNSLQLNTGKFESEENNAVVKSTLHALVRTLTSATVIANEAVITISREIEQRMSNGRSINDINNLEVTECELMDLSSSVRRLLYHVREVVKDFEAGLITVRERSFSFDDDGNISEDIEGGISGLDTRE